VKTLKNLFTTILVLFSMSSFAQRYTHWEGTYVMDYGNQTMRIKSTGGNYYKAFFTGNCNARTVEGEVDNGELVFPLVGGRSGDMILISREGNKLSVDVRGKEVMRRSCGGNSIIGLYSSKNNNNYSNYNSYNDKYYKEKYDNRDSYHSGSTYIIRSRESGLVLDANMHSSEAVSVYRQHGGANQKWIIKRLRGNDVSIENAANGKVLTVNSSSIVSLQPWRDSTNQKWYLERLSSNEYIIVSKANSKVLDVSKGSHNMTTFKRNGTAHQKWILEKTY